MKKLTTIIPLFLLILFTLQGCDFLNGIFKTGVGVGIFIAVVLFILIFGISRIGKGNKL